MIITTVLPYRKTKILYQTNSYGGNGILNHPIRIPLSPLKKYLISSFQCRNKGAVTLEYAICMVVATVLMIGVQVMFNTMAQEIINEFKNIVSSFPAI